MRKKVLIVEDNALMVEVISHILINNGYEVLVLSNGSEVFSYIKTNHPDLVILEDILPGINGIDICQLIKLNRATQNLPVIICSEDDAITPVLKQKGAPDDILHKPFDISCLIEKVEYLLAA